MEKTEIQTLMLAIAGLDTKVTGIRTELGAKIDQGFARVDQRLDRIERDLKPVREQTALNSEEISALSQGKSPSA